MPAKHNLLLRILSGVCLGAIAIWGVVWSNFILNCVLLITAYIAGREWNALVAQRANLPGFAGLLGVRRNSRLPMILLLLWLLAVNTRPDVYIGELVVMTLLLGLISMLGDAATMPFRMRERLIDYMRSLWDSRLAILGVPYIGATMLSLMALHRAQNWHAMVFLLAVVWATDTFAYAVGRTIGGPKLAPAISPGKTWAGVIGGFAGAALVAAALSQSSGGVSVAHSAMVGCGISLLTQAGDLFESFLKRRFGVKDSGFLIPGHGGILDRIDGLLLAAPIFTLYRLWLGGSL